MMTRRVHWTAATATVLLGSGHIALTLPIHGTLSLTALWFAGSGLAMVFAGLMNMVALRAIDRASGLPAFLTSALSAAFFAMIWLSLKEPQVVVGLGLFVVMAGLSLTLGRAGRPDIQAAAGR